MESTKRVSEKGWPLPLRRQVDQPHIVFRGPQLCHFPFCLIEHEVLRYRQDKQYKPNPTIGAPHPVRPRIGLRLFSIERKDP
jgi:hypothetical protein